MKKKLAIGIASLVIFAVFFIYLDPLEINQSLFEKIKGAVKQKDPIKVAERIIGIPSEATIFDKDYNVEIFVKGLDRPTTMTFVGDDILVAEKNYGKVKLVRNGIVQQQPVLDVEVNNQGERGLLGIISVNSTVYLYFTGAEHDSGNSTGNYIYKYAWNGQKLVEPALMNHLPGQSPTHNGGAMVSDLQNNIYAVIGDQKQVSAPSEKFGILQNYPRGSLDDTGVIIKVGLDSEIQPSHSSDPLEHYYAIGIRNSFGLAVDPLTGNLWDTENGDDKFDEINLVNPGFNSGWARIMGPSTIDQLSYISNLEGFTYSDPEFSWERTVAPTGMVFVNSPQFHNYNNDLFVGDCHLGNLYVFTLNGERTGFVFKNPDLSDFVANVIPKDKERSFEPMDEILFGTGFGCITDVDLGPDGNLYVVSITSGTIYRIVAR